MILKYHPACTTIRTHLSRTQSIHIPASMVYERACEGLEIAKYRLKNGRFAHPRITIEKDPFSSFYFYIESKNDTVPMMSECRIEKSHSLLTGKARKHRFVLWIFICRCVIFESECHEINLFITDTSCLEKETFFCHFVIFCTEYFETRRSLVIKNDLFLALKCE